MLIPQLVWQKRHPQCPTTKEDRVVRKLLDKSTGMELGLVCETADSMYWSFTTSPSLRCMPTYLYLTKHQSITKAMEQLSSYVSAEFSKPYEPCLTRKLKRRDREAYTLRKTTLETTADAFKSGVEWILKSEGFPRRPEWARFLVQNRNGQFYWFESKPIATDSGKWHCDTGRSTAVHDSASWQTHVVELL